MSQNTDDPEDFQESLLRNSAPVTSPKPKRLSSKVVFRIVCLITISLIAQETLFCVLTWKVGLSVAVGVQGGWVFMSLMVMCFLTISGVPLPIPRGNSRAKTVFTLLIGCGLLFSAITAIAGGYQLANYLHLEIDQPNVDLLVSPEHLSVPGAQRLTRFDYVRFSPGFRVMRSEGRRILGTSHHYFCAAPVVGKHETGRAYFYAVSQDTHCCSFDSFDCFGWDSTIANAIIIKGTERAKYEDAISLIADSMKSTQLPSVVVQFTNLDPTEGAQPYLLRGLIITGCGFVLWPLPALLTHYWMEGK